MFVSSVRLLSLFLLILIWSTPSESWMCSPVPMMQRVTKKSATPKVDIAFDVATWRKGFESCEKEVCELLPGEVPSDLVGTLYRNGYGKFKIGKGKVMHPFDGDGLASAVTFNNGAAWFRNRFIRTSGYVQERNAKKILFRGAFGTPKPGGILANFLNVNLKNTANTNIVYWANRLLALWEAGNPYQLDPASLSTIGEYKMRGVLKNGQPFSAHPKIDANTNRLVTFSAEPTPSKTTVTVFEFNEELNTEKERKFEVDGFGFFHDFVVTKQYYLFTQCPLDFKPLPFLLGQKGPAECITLKDGLPAVLHIVPRDGSPVMKVLLDSHFNFHYSNAYEDDKGDIIMDVIRCGKMNLGNTWKERQPIWETLNYEKDVPYSKLVRYTLHQDQVNTNSWKYSAKELHPQSVEFPIVNPTRVGKKNRYIFTSCGSEDNMPSPVKGIMKIDVDENKSWQWFGDSDEFISEPAFAVKQSASCGDDEDDGYLVAIATKTNSLTSDVVVFDAKDIAKGPISRLPIPTYIPYGLHGSFVANLTFDFEETQHKFKEFDVADEHDNKKVGGGFSGLGIKYLLRK